MKLNCGRYRITLVPETEIEESYLEEVFGLRLDGDAVKAKRVNASNLNCWAYVEITREPLEKD